MPACLQLDYVTSSSRSALRAVFSSWSLDECHTWLSDDIGLQMVLEEETRKWFPASNSGREVSRGGGLCPQGRLVCWMTFPILHHTYGCMLATWVC